MTRFISDDTSRCAGRFGLGPDDPVCDRRERCLRYLALLERSTETPVPIYVHVATGLCRDGGDWMIEGEA